MAWLAEDTGVLVCRRAHQFNGTEWIRVPREMMDEWAREAGTPVLCDNCGRPLDRNTQRRYAYGARKEEMR